MHFGGYGRLVMAFYLGDGRVSCQDVANVVWPQSAVSVARGIGQ
jgi:hypothetical protein